MFKFNQLQRISIIFILLCTILSFSETRGVWVPCQTDDTTNSTFSSWVGNNVILYNSIKSNKIYAFNTKCGEWKTISVPTSSYWNGKAASDYLLPYDGEQEQVGMMWNDSLVICFSGITNTFHILAHGDTLLGLDRGRGCRGKMAWFLTRKALNVFTADDTTWHTYLYTTSFTDFNSINVYSFCGKSYICFDLYSTSGATNNHYLIAFSEINRKFTEYNGPVLHKSGSQGILEHGFTFYSTDQTDPAKNFIAGYSSYKGTIDTIRIHGTLSDVSLKGGRKNNSCIYLTNIDSEDWKTHTITFYSFNQYTGKWKQYSFSFDPATLEPVCPMSMGAGGAFTYSAVIGSLTSGVFNVFIHGPFEDSLLVIPTTLDKPFTESTLGSFVGDSILILYNKSRCVGIDVWGNRIATLELPEQNPASGSSFLGCLEDVWGIFKFKSLQSDTIYYYSYNSRTNRFSEYKEYSPSQSDIITNVNSGYISTGGGGKWGVHVYSRGTDTWHHFDLGSEMMGNASVKPNFTVFYDVSNKSTIIVDGTTGEKFTIQVTSPISWPSYGYDCFYSSDYAVLVYDPDSTCHFYSAITHRLTKFKMPFAKTEGRGAIIVAAYYSKVLTFNARHDCLVTLELTSDQGLISSMAVTGSTAFFKTNKGWIFAFDPERTSQTMTLPKNSGKGLLNNESSSMLAHFNVHSGILSIYFENKEPSPLSIRVFNLAGKLILKHDFMFTAQNKGTIRIPCNLGEGIYICSISKGKKENKFSLVHKVNLSRKFNK